MQFWHVMSGHINELTCMGSLRELCIYSACYGSVIYIEYSLYLAVQMLQKMDGGTVLPRVLTRFLKVERVK